MVGDSTPKFSAPPQQNILERASIRSIEQKERYRVYRELFELMVVITVEPPYKNTIGTDLHSYMIILKKIEAWHE